MRIADKVHFHDDSERDYFAVLGKYISAWGRFETGLYQLNRIVGLEYRRVLEVSGAEALPRAFKPGKMPFEHKLELLEKAMRQRPELWAPQDRVRDLLEWAKEEALARHHLIHGVDQLFLQRSPYETHMYRAEKKAAPVDESSNGIKFDVESIARRYDQIGSACLNLIILFREAGDLVDDLLSTLEHDQNIVTDDFRAARD